MQPRYPHTPFPNCPARKKVHFLRLISSCYSRKPTLPSSSWEIISSFNWPGVSSSTLPTGNSSVDSAISLLHTFSLVENFKTSRGNALWNLASCWYPKFSSIQSLLLGTAACSFENRSQTHLKFDVSRPGCLFFNFDADTWKYAVKTP